VIEGLYAAGNAMSSPLGMTYGGARGTLGPAMVFGHIAGRDIAKRVKPAHREPAMISPTALAAAHGGA
jgi:succinate dehydrogenase/fumarate reductase flavoprotein subunit